MKIPSTVLLGLLAGMTALLSPNVARAQTTSGERALLGRGGGKITLYALEKVQQPATLRASRMVSGRHALLRTGEDAPLRLAATGRTGARSRAARPRLDGEMALQGRRRRPLRARDTGGTAAED